MQKTRPDSQKESSTAKADEVVRRLLVLTGSGERVQRSLNDLRGHLAQDSLLSAFQWHDETEPEAALSLLRAGQFDLLIVLDQSPSTWIAFLQVAGQISPATISLLLADQWDESSLRAAINRSHVYRALALSLGWNEILQQIRSASLEAELSRAQLGLMREASKQNRELEELTTGLEKLVEERTVVIHKAKEETEEQLDHSRHLIRLTKDLSQNISFEEIMSLIRREVRRYSKLGDPILVLQLDQNDLEILSFRSGILQESRFQSNFPFPEDKTRGDKELSLALANLLGRPFIQVMAFPLEIRLIQKYGHATSAALLCFESNLNEIEQNEFLNEFEDILRPVGMAVDRSFLEREMMIHSLRWEKTFDGLRDPIAVIDEAHQVLRSNSKFSDRLIQRKCFQAFGKLDAPCPGCPLENSLQSNQRQTSLINIGGRQYQVNSYPIRLAHASRASSVVNQYIDVTYSREIYGRMLQSEKMSALGLLAGNIAHELNNPLSGIRNLTQVMLSEVDQLPESQQTLRTDLLEIERAAQRSQKIIKNLLDYSGEGDHQVVPTALADIVEKTLPLLKTVLRQHRLQQVLEGRDSLVRVDPHLLQQVVFNLVTNACQAMSQTGNLKIETGVRKSPIAEAFLKISDSGPGIPEALREKIFDPFFTTKPEGQGTGLGLSLSRDLVRRFGGELRLVESNQGATFEVAIPLQVSTDEDLL